MLLHLYYILVIAFLEDNWVFISYFGFRTTYQLPPLHNFPMHIFSVQDSSPYNISIFVWNRWQSWVSLTLFSCCLVWIKGIWSLNHLRWFICESVFSITSSLNIHSITLINLFVSPLPPPRFKSFIWTMVHMKYQWHGTSLKAKQGSLNMCLMLA